MTDSFLSDEDKALFRKQMETMTPLKTNTSKATSHAKAVKSSTPKALEQPKTVHNPYFLSDYIKETVLSHTQLSYTQSSVSTKQQKALEKGLIPFEARLDLHGFKIEAAREALCDFILKQTQVNRRCVLIIHGKGGHQGAPPVIKNQINRWLPQMEEVLAFRSALPKHGGQGAVYVLLKRNKVFLE